MFAGLIWLVCYVCVGFVVFVVCLLVVFCGLTEEFDVLVLCWICEWLGLVLVLVFGWYWCVVVRVLCCAFGVALFSWFVFVL